jgi:hypothetical protein
LDELGWLPPGEMVGLELLRLNRRMAGGSRQADAECRQRQKREAELAALQQREIRFGRQARSVEARRSDPRSSAERARKQLAHFAKRSGCRAGAGDSWKSVDYARTSLRPLTVGQRCERPLWKWNSAVYYVHSKHLRALTLSADCQSGNSVVHCRRTVCDRRRATNVLIWKLLSRLE